MAATSMVGAPNDAPSAYILTVLVGTETVTIAVPAGKVASIGDSVVNLRSINIDVIVEQLRDAFREQVSKLI